MGKNKKEDQVPEMELDDMEEEIVNVVPPPLTMYTQLLAANKAATQERQEKGKKFRGRVPFYQLFRYADKLDIFLNVIAIAAAIGTGIMFPLFLLSMGDIVDSMGTSVTDFTESQFMEMLNISTPLSEMGMSAIMKIVREYVNDQVWGSIRMLLILGGASGAATIIYVLASTSTATRQADQIRKHYFESAMAQEMGWFDSHQTGALTTTLTDIQSIQDGIGEKVPTLFLSVSNFLGGVIVAFVKGWQMALIILAVAPVLIIVVAVLSVVLRNLFSRSTSVSGLAGEVSEEILSASKTVITLGIEEQSLGRYNEYLTIMHHLNTYKGWALGGTMGAMQLLLFCAFGLAFWYGGKLIMDGTMTAGNVLIVFMGIMMGTMALTQLSGVISALVNAAGAAFDVFGTIDRKSAIDPREDVHKPGVDDNFEIQGDIQFHSICFRYPTRPEAEIIRNFDLHIPKGKTVALVGPSGCGKSTIVGLLERFYDCEEGFGDVIIDGKPIHEISINCLRRQIGIVTQEPVLFATTIAQNIAWGSSHGDGSIGTGPNASCTMEDIIECAKQANAHDFIMKLSDGYDTMVGQRGAQLSGGQKQRIAIARALIRKPKILIFDEATSALDTKSEADVQEAIDKVAGNCTCIIIAHRLSTVRNADKICAVNNGAVQEEGTHDELMQIPNGLYRSLVERQAAIVNTAKRDKHHHRVPKTSTTTTKKDKKKDDKDGSASEDVSSRSPSPASSSDTPQPALVSRSPTPVDKEKLKERKKLGAFAGMTIEEERAQKKEIDKNTWKVIKRAFSLLKPSWPYVTFASILSVISGAIMPCFALLMARVMGVLMYNPDAPGSITSSEHEHELVFWSVAFVVLGVIAGVCNLLNIKCMFFTADRMLHYLRYESFKSMLRQDAAWFDDPKNMTGVLTTRLATDTTLMFQLTANQITTVISCCASLVAGIVVGFIGYWKVALVVLACVPVLLVTTIFHMRLMTRYAQKIKTTYEESGRIASEGLENIRTVITMGREKTFLHEFAEQLRYPMKLGYRTNLYHAICAAIQSMFGFFVSALAFWYGVQLLVDGDPVSFEGIMKAQMGIMFGAQSLGQMSVFFPDYGKTIAAGYHIFTLLDRVPPVPNPRTTDYRPIRKMDYTKIHDDDVEYAKQPMAEDDPRPRRTLDTVRGEITFEDVVFRYPTRPDVPVLNGLSFTAKPKETVALVGESGCGKSTSVSLIERLYNPISGTIKLDGVPINELEIGWLRRQIGLVSQEPILFATTIRENIRYGRPDATDAEIEEAARQSNAHGFITKFPDGYDTKVGEKGVTLSGGQKQRIAIARALIRNPKVLLLDEATSALDNESEKVVQAALDRAREGRTTIVIAHRLSTIRDADKIVVVANGVMDSCGTHDELIADKNGLYAKLANAQSVL